VVIGFNFLGIFCLITWPCPRLIFPEKKEEEEVFGKLKCGGGENNFQTQKHFRRLEVTKRNFRKFTKGGF
jgi:hypothetical protein